MLIMAAALAAIIVGCGQTTKPKLAGPSQSATAPKAKPTVFAIGDAIQMGDIKLTINGARIVKDDLVKPDGGKLILAVDATVENVGTEPAAVSSMMQFKLVDSDGYSQTFGFTTKGKGQLDGELAAGRKMRGELVWYVDPKAKGLELTYDPSLIGTGQAIVKMGDVASFQK